MIPRKQTCPADAGLAEITDIAPASSITDINPVAIFLMALPQVAIDIRRLN
jgi:hypothetical protein